MRQTKFHIPLFKTGLLLIVVLSGCSLTREPSPTTDRQTYIDANLQFSIAYPESWAPFLSRSGRGIYIHNSVVWEVQNEGLNNDPSLQVISMLTTGFIPEAQPADILFDIYPNLTLVSRTDTNLKIGKAQRLDGYTPHKTLRAWIYRSSLRDFLLIFTAPPEYFTEQSALFDDIAHSFEVLPQEHR